MVTNTLQKMPRLKVAAESVELCHQSDGASIRLSRGQKMAFLRRPPPRRGLSHPPVYVPREQAAPAECLSSVQIGGVTKTSRIVPSSLLHSKSAAESLPPLAYLSFLSSPSPPLPFSGVFSSFDSLIFHSQGEAGSSVSIQTR